MQTSQDYIFYILRYFAAKPRHFTKFRMLFPAVLMNIPNSTTLHERRNQASEKFFNQILESTIHKLFNLISKVDPLSCYNLRKVKKLEIPKFKTERFKNASSLNTNK